MANYDEEDGPEHGAIQSILDMLESKGGELMRDKYGPKEEAKPVVTVEIKSHGKAPEGGKEEDGELTDDMLKHLLGDEEDGDEAKE